jgi:uncharacterized protein YbaR (Trm112 family)
MSERDKKYIEEIKNRFKDIVSTKEYTHRKKLTNKIIAQFFTLNGSPLDERKLNYQLKKEDEHFFNVSRLLTLQKGLNNYDMDIDSPYKQVTLFIRQLCIVQMKEEGVVLGDLIKDVNDYDETIKLFFATAQSILIQIAFEGGASHQLRQANLAQMLELLAAPCHVEELTITVNKKDMESNIHLIKEWAYRKEGNFSDRLSVNVIESRYNPLDIISGKVNGEIKCYIEHNERYYPISDSFKELIYEEAKTLSQQLARWSLWKSPEMRILTKLEDEYPQEELPSMLIEAIKNTYEEDTGHEEGNPFDHIESAIKSIVVNQQERANLLNKLEYLRVQLN